MNRPLAAAAAAFALAFAAVFFLALHTSRGLHADGELYGRASGSGLATVQRAGERTLATIDVGSLVVGALLLGLLALLRGRVGRALAAVALVVVSVCSAELLKHALPHVAGALPPGREASFPSGHTAVAVSLGLALVLAAPPLLRPAAAVLGAAYAAAVAFSLVALGWHFPSDVAGSFFLCGFWASLAAAAAGGVVRKPTISFGGAAVGVVAVAAGLVVAAWLASRHPLAVAEVRSRDSLLATAALAGVLSAATFALAPLLEERRGRR